MMYDLEGNLNGLYCLVLIAPVLGFRSWKFWQSSLGCVHLVSSAHCSHCAPMVERMYVWVMDGDSIFRLSQKYH